MPVEVDMFTGWAQPAVRLPGRSPPKIAIYSKVLAASHVRDDLVKVMVLVDVGKLGAITTEQLCDYLLMIAYAQIDPEGDTADYDTILNLFEDPSVPGLTVWDRAYLSGLYEADPTRRADANAQGGRLAEALRQDEPPAAE